MNQPIVFLDGELIEADQAQLDALTPGVLTAPGVFETMRVYQGEIPFLSEHLERLVLGLKNSRIPVPARSFLRHKMKETLEANHLKDARLRLALWMDTDQRRIQIVCQPYQPYSEEKYREGFKAMTIGYRRQKLDPTGQFKSLGYRFFLQSRLRAEKKGFDEAILVDPKGWLIEGTRTNIFLIRGDHLLTPSAQTGCLEGITRKQVISLAGGAGLRSMGLLLKPSEFDTADEAFLTNSLLEIMPLTTVGKVKIGSGQCGPKTRDLQTKYKELLQRSLTLDV